ncbi:MAG: hypothetical protein QN122_04545 [Armatimonadota bacterium]|nr:hypothetical protein [Armatimonadota bacterium]MDR7450096.1 hypothetical protein [Armatimonadota bacterium]MDR7460594.1 hypothetical protein [Armatimonadota bacterium]MDR7480049.1 hypothetical protein [Armatimonadota bacterium]MDR7489457.1 hypothetical protein [Armatimonadota bacterium]
MVANGLPRPYPAGVEVAVFPQKARQRLALRRLRGDLDWLEGAPGAAR